jgi:hypothetical protein
VLIPGTPQLLVITPQSIAGTYLAGAASFGPKLSFPGLTSLAFPVIDGGNRVTLDHEVTDGSKPDGAPDDLFRKATVYEIWDKNSRNVVWLAKSFTEKLLDKRNRTVFVSDNFDDGNDTSPAPAWVRHDPIHDAGVPGGCYSGATFTFPGGGYRLFSPAPCVPDAGGPRAYSLREETAWDNFYISVDALSWDDTVRELFGLAARVNNPGPGTTLREAVWVDYFSDAGDFSVSTKPRVSRAPLLPWKISPKSTMNTSGKARVQKTAALSRV